jgi:hypothetical protein
MVVPHETAQTEFTVWIGTRVSPPTSGLTLQVGSRLPMDVPGNWAIFEVQGQPKFWSQRITVDSVESGRRYPLRLLLTGDAVATGTAATLPDQLPRLGATPFTCLIGSCFAHYNDAAGAAGAAYRSLPAAARPDVKFLSGDPV